MKSVSSENGTCIEDLITLLGSKQAVHYAAYTARKKGCITKFTKGKYIIINRKEEEKAIETIPTKTLFGIDLSVIDELDDPSKNDFIEQMRRVKLHLGIAMAIVDSHYLTKNLMGEKS